MTRSVSTRAPRPMSRSGRIGRAAIRLRPDPRTNRPADRRPNRSRRQLLIAVFARGHCILEGVPGLAKTLMVHSLAQSLSLDSTGSSSRPT